MKFDRAGWPFFFGALALAAAVALFISPFWAIPAVVLAVGLLCFFRDPHRPLPTDQALIMSPADGRVMAVGSAGNDAPPGNWQQVTIFLSPLDVHINRTPVSGTVMKVTHKPGKFLPAYKPESGAVNEQSEIWMDHNGRTAIYRQVVGLLARRVVCRVKVGDTLVVGQRMGVMKFGSRMDVFVPLDIDLQVKPGDRVVAGVSVFGRWI
jgi:phosphatidylserine decarboxylase